MSETVEFASVERAQELVLSCVTPGATERVSLCDALGRVLAEPVVTDVDNPPFDKAMMDGYAVRVADGQRDLRVVGWIAAGQEGYKRSLGAGEAMQINTGAPIPRGADAVVRVEDTHLSADGSRVALEVPPKPGMNIDRQGKHVSAGSVVLDRGTRINAACTAAAAAAGAATVTTYRRPRVAVMVTGDELVDVSCRPRGGQIRNSNGPMLEALVRGAHGEARHVGIVGDDRSALEEHVRRVLSSDVDVLCVCGGVSMGAFDFVPEVLARCGVRTVVRKVALKPGKPTLFGVSREGTCVFGLPGNPIGAFVAFWLLVRPALESRQGRPDRLPFGMRARLVGSCKETQRRQTYWPVRIARGADGELLAERLGWHGSGDAFGFSSANGLVVRRPGAASASDGERVEVIPLEGW